MHEPKSHAVLPFATFDPRTLAVRWLLFLGDEMACEKRIKELLRGFKRTVSQPRERLRDDPVELTKWFGERGVTLTFFRRHSRRNVDLR